MSPVFVGDVDTSHHRCAPLSSLFVDGAPHCHLSSLHVVVALVDVAPHCRLSSSHVVVALVDVASHCRLSSLHVLASLVNVASPMSSRLLSVVLHTFVVTRSCCAPDVFTSSIGRTSRLRRNSLMLRPRCLHVFYRSYFTSSP